MEHAFQNVSCPTLITLRGDSSRKVVPGPIAVLGPGIDERVRANPVKIWNNESISNRVIAIDLIQKLPNDPSLQETAREMEFVASVQESIEQLGRGEELPANKVR